MKPEETYNYESRWDFCESIVTNWLNGNRSDALDALEAGGAAVTAMVTYTCDAIARQEITTALINRAYDRNLEEILNTTRKGG